MATQQYKVVGGDTLSAIAKKYGVKVADISGYKSGNPNLIYPGETLSFQTPTLGIQPQPTTTAATTTPIVKPSITPSATLPLLPTTPGLTKTPLPLVSQAQVTTQPPIITTTDKPKVGTSLIDAGKSAIQELTNMGVSSDINTIRSNWAKFGLDTKLGNWIGSATQWNAYSKYAKDELERIETGLKQAQQTLTAGQEKVATEGITPTPETPTLTPSTTPTNLTPEQLTTVQLSNTDIGDIINEIESWTAATPETVIAGEAAKLLTDDEKARAGQALVTFQQQMAKAGQAFSSIRSSGEAAIAAESLSRQSGINLDLATKIVNAARTEQTNRIKAINDAQKLQTESLKSMGYVVDPITGTLQKTLERERFEEPKEPKYFSSQGDYLAFDPYTGELTKIYEAPASERNLNIHYFTDDTGNVIKVVSDPLSGQEISRESLGQLGKESSYYFTMRSMGYDPTNPDDINRFNEDFGITTTPTAEDSDFFQDVLDFMGGVFK